MIEVSCKAFQGLRPIWILCLRFLDVLVAVDSSFDLKWDVWSSNLNKDWWLVLSRPSENMCLKWETLGIFPKEEAKHPLQTITAQILSTFCGWTLVAMLQRGEQHHGLHSKPLHLASHHVYQIAKSCTCSGGWIYTGWSRPAQKSSAPHPRRSKNNPSMQSNVSNVSNPSVAEPSFFTIWLLVSLALPPNWLGTSRRVYNVIWFNQMSLCASTMRPA